MIEKIKKERIQAGFPALSLGFSTRSGLYFLSEKRGAAGQLRYVYANMNQISSLSQPTARLGTPCTWDTFSIF